MKHLDNTLREPGLLRLIVEIVIIAAIYFISARISLLFAVYNSNASPVWLPSGIALALVLIRGYRIGPAILIGAFLSNVMTLKGIAATPVQYFVASLMTAVGNMLEAIIGAYLINRFTGTGNPFSNIRHLFIFIFYGALVCTAVSATAGVLSFSIITPGRVDFILLWITWWTGDAAGILILSPPIMMMWNKKWQKFDRSMAAESVIVFVFLILLTFLIFWRNLNLDYLIIPPLIWIAIRLGRFNAALALILTSGIAITGTILGNVPVAEIADGKSLLYLQSYIMVCSIIMLCLSVLTHENRESEKSLTVAQKKSYDIIEFLPDATFAVDTDGKVIAWNRAIEKITGIPKKDMIGKGDYAYAVPFIGNKEPLLIDAARLNTDLEKLSVHDSVNMTGKTMFVDQYNRLLKRYLSSAASALVEDDGTIYGAIESIRDVTGQKEDELELKLYKEHLEEMVKERSDSLVKANEELTRQIMEKDRVARALAESELKYRDLVESANSIILRWKPDGSITFINTYAQKFFNYTENEILGKSIFGTIVDDIESTGRSLPTLIKEIVDNPEGHVVNENENIRKTGERVWIAWTNKPIYGNDGSLREILSVGNDITARITIEKSLKKTLRDLALAKNQAESADRLKSAFLANMSHELRTPLNSIIGFTGIILQGLAGPLTDEQKKQLNIVKTSARHLLSLINDILDLSKIESGQLTIHSAPFDLRSSVLSVIESMRLSIENKGLALQVDLSDDINVITGDQRHIEQIMLNLLSNALKFTDTGTICIRGSRAGASLQISVTDTGIGISDSDIDKLFKPFRQLDVGTARKYEGTGLGLSICKKLVELMGGNITVTSVTGKGSMFAFTLPSGDEQP